MAIKIDKQIIEYEVKTAVKADPADAGPPSGGDASAEHTSKPPKTAEIIQMHERV